MGRVKAESSQLSASALVWQNASQTDGLLRMPAGELLIWFQDPQNWVQNKSTDTTSQTKTTESSVRHW
jgi:hypothetical protein